MEVSELWICVDDPRLLAKIIEVAQAGWTVLEDSFVIPKDGTEYLVYTLTRADVDNMNSPGR